MSGTFGQALQSNATGYSVVYHVEIGLLFITLIALGPLVRARGVTTQTTGPIALTEFPT
jgi:BCD family chlorophyll transporter-like MFS transporter